MNDQCYIKFHIMWKVLMHIAPALWCMKNICGYKLIAVFTPDFPVCVFVCFVIIGFLFYGRKNP